MLNKKFSLFVVVLAILFFASCGEKEYGGESVINYPDLEQLLADKLDSAQPYVYTRVNYDGVTTDSAQVSSADMPWNEIRKLFKKANFYDYKLDRKYSIDILQDSLANTRTFFYEALDPKVFTKNMSIVSDDIENGLKSIYFECADKSNNYKVLLIPNELIQLQESSNEKVMVRSYYFP